MSPIKRYIIADVKDGRTQYWATAEGLTAKEALENHVAKSLAVSPTNSTHGTRLRNAISVTFAVAAKAENSMGVNQVPITGIYFFDVERVNTHVVKEAT